METEIKIRKTEGDSRRDDDWGQSERSQKAAGLGQFTAEKSQGAAGLGQLSAESRQKQAEVSYDALKVEEQAALGMELKKRFFQTLGYVLSEEEV